MLFSLSPGNGKAKKKISNILNDKIKNQEIFKSFITLSLILSDVIENVFNELRINNQDIDLEPLFDYYDDIFINKFPPICRIILIKIHTESIMHVKRIIRF